MRIAVVGTSGSGKTTFSRELGARLDAPHIELDALHWGPNWAAAATDVFRERVGKAMSADRWICDGNYAAVRDLVWARATGVVILNYSFPRVFYRAVSRTLRRGIRREKLYGDNVESLSVFDPEWIPWWVIRTYRGNRRLYRELMGRREYAQLDLREFTRPSQAAGYLAGLPDPQPPGGSECPENTTGTGRSSL